MPLKRQSLGAERLISALTAADAIAQAELELRLFPPLVLISVEPYDQEKHGRPARSAWGWGEQDLEEESPQPERRPSP